MKVTLYTTGCPKCAVLKAKLDTKGVEFDTVTNTEEMARKGFEYLPMLEVDGVIYDFAKAIKWINER